MKLDTNCPRALRTWLKPNPQWFNYNKTPFVVLHFYINGTQLLVAWQISASHISTHTLLEYKLSHAKWGHLVQSRAATPHQSASCWQTISFSVPSVKPGECHSAHITLKRWMARWQQHHQGCSSMAEVTFSTKSSLQLADTMLALANIAPKLNNSLQVLSKSPARAIGRMDPRIYARVKRVPYFLKPPSGINEDTFSKKQREGTRVRGMNELSFMEKTVTLWTPVRD